LIDENNEGYIAPYDMYSADPYVCGINMEDLRKVIYMSQNKASVVVILDCCYAGIATKSTKSVSDSQTKIAYETNLKKLTQSPDTDKLVSSGRGKIILASSESNAPSREKRDCKHYNGNDNPHTHGTFTFHLLEGLDGKAADPDTGVITIDNLRKHIENQMNYEGRQKPMYYIALPSQIEDIKIAVSQTQFNKKISQLIGDVEQRLNQKIEGSSLVDIQTLTEAAKDLRELESLDPKNKERPILVKALDDALHMYKEPMEKWINRNMLLVRPKINQIQAGLYDNTLYSLIESLSYNELKNFDQVNLQYLIILCSEIINNKQ
jgi:hypothetical protein